MLHYFAHGSNMWLPRLEHRVGPVRVVGVGRLDDFALRWHKRSRDGSGKCDVVPVEGAQVWGVLYALEGSQLHALDRVEGVGNGYERNESLSVSRGEERVAVATYRAQPAHIDDTLLPYDWYHALVLAGARRHALPGAYIAEIARHPVIPDKDAERAASERAWLGGATE